MTKLNIDHSIKGTLNDEVNSTPSRKEDPAIAELSQKFTDLEKKYKEVNFVWALVLMIMLNILWLRDCNNWSLPWIIGILELVIAFMLSIRFDIDSFKILSDMVHSVLDKNSK